MGSTKDRNLWQCANLFRRTCPHQKHPVMKSVVASILKKVNDMTLAAIDEAEALCENCPDFMRGAGLSAGSDVRRNAAL